jgi:hypothetical protein
VSKNIVIAVDATERSVDALTLGKVLADATGPPVVLLTVFRYPSLEEPRGEELLRVREALAGFSTSSARLRA